MWSIAEKPWRHKVWSATLMIGGRLLFAISVQLRQMAGGDGSTPVERGGPLGLMGSGTHISCQIKSTPTADRHRSAAPNGGSGQTAPQNGGTSGGGSTQASGSEVLGRNPGYRQYGEDTEVPGGKITLDLIAVHNQDFPNN